MARKCKHTFRPGCEDLEGRQLLLTITNVYSGKVLDDTGFSTRNGTLIQQWQSNGGLNQQWNLVPLRDGNFEIQNVYSGKVLDDTGFSKRNGTPIQQWQWNNTLNQEWKVG